MKVKFKSNNLVSKVVLVFFLVITVLYIFRYAAYFKRNTEESMLVSIQNLTDVELTHPVYIDENNIVYLSEEDVREYLDQELYYEKNSSNMRRYISISQNKILEITEKQNHIFVNGTREKIKGAVIEREGIYYFPISELEKVYNIKVDYLKDKNRLNIEKLSEEKLVAVVNRDIKLKYKMTNISKDIEELFQGDNVTIVQDMNNDWVKVKTEDYAVGYVKKSKLVDTKNERYNLNKDDYSDFNIEEASIIEINDSTYQDFNMKISKYDNRRELINDILGKVSAQMSSQPKSVAVKVNVTTVENNENYYKFLKELRAHVNDLGTALAVTEQPNMDKKELKKISNILL